MAKNNARAPLGTFGTVGIVFLILKLCGLIHWSWVWVLSPFWIPIALLFVIFLIYFISSLFKK